ncbi:MAG: FAD-binding oxidoreductase [Nitrospirae bacterium]|nr:MAG: FAD-binding oxidoreductase [Nitrospirota bacterium]
MNRYQSWGRYPTAVPSAVVTMTWQHDAIPFDAAPESFLPYGYGRSYGDSCLNDGGVLLDTRRLRRFLAFDPILGTLRCEAGTSLADILALIVPRGWFLPVTPGTKFVSIGGAIANDVHGKNHHRAGTFGRFVRCFELLRSTGERVYCSPTANADLFKATIGGLGLTGLILWAEIQLKPIVNPWIMVERIPFNHIAQFFDLSAETDRRYEYTVAWIDCFARGTARGRGIFIGGNHHHGDHPTRASQSASWSWTVPFTAPSCLLSPLVLKLFNRAYYALRSASARSIPEHYDQFFYPLDKIREWNRLYGRHGLLQYQCVIPPPHQQAGITAILDHIHRAKEGSFLAVLKQFGSLPSPGLLSFPREGTTLALDFPFRGASTLALLNTLDAIVRECGGAVYPAKDARMSPRQFEACFPQWREFLAYRDPKFSSSFWRRVTDNVPIDPLGHTLSGFPSRNSHESTLALAGDSSLYEQVSS